MWHRRIAIAIFFLCVLAAPAHAKRSGPQPIESFEASFIHSQGVWVHGRLMPADPSKQTFTLEVYEKIRNASNLPDSKFLTLHARTWNEGVAWRNQFVEREALFCLSWRVGPDFEPDTYSVNDMISSESLQASSRFDRDGRALKTLDQLLTAARRVADLAPQTQNARYRLLPESDAAKSFGDGTVSVPRDDYFKTRNLEWAKSDNPLARRSAADAFRYLMPPSAPAADPEVVTALRKLATDPYAETREIHPWAQEDFVIRQVSISILDGPIPRSRGQFLSVPLTGPTSIYRDLSIWRSSALTLFILCCALGGMHFWRRPRRLISPAAVIWGLVATAILLIGYHSHSVTRELVWTTNDTCHSLASRDGNIEYQQLYSWYLPARNELLYARFDSREMPDFLWKPLNGWQSSFAGFGIGKGGIYRPYDLQTALPRHPALRLSAPWWSVSIPFWLIAAGITISRFRAGRRTRKGYCALCGYDLRASPTRCPECGANAASA